MAVTGHLQPRRSVDEKGRVVTEMFLTELVEGSLSQSLCSRRIESYIEQAVCVAIDRSVQPISYVIKLEHCFIDRSDPVLLRRTAVNPPSVPNENGRSKSANTKVIENGTNEASPSRWINTPFVSERSGRREDRCIASGPATTDYGSVVVGGAARPLNTSVRTRTPLPRLRRRVMSSFHNPRNISDRLITFISGTFRIILSNSRRVHGSG